MATAACAPVVPPTPSSAVTPAPSPSASAEPVIDLNCFYTGQAVIHEFARIESVLERYPSPEPTQLARQDGTLRSAGGSALSDVLRAGDTCFSPDRVPAFEALATYLKAAGSSPIDTRHVRDLMHNTGIDICEAWGCPTLPPVAS